MPSSARHVAPQSLDPVEQVATALGLDQVDQLEPELEDQLFHGDAGGDRLGGVRRGDGRRLLGFDLLGGRVLGQARAEEEDAPTHNEKGQLREPRDDGEAPHDQSGRPHDRPVAGQLRQDVVAQVVLGGGPGHDDARRQRQQQGRDLRDQPVSDRQEAVGGDGVGEREVVLGHPDGEAADQVDRGDDDGGDGVAPDELRGPVHRSVEIGLVGHLLAPATCLGLVDGTCVQVGIDRHLLARHAVEGEPGCDLGHPARSRRDHDELDDDEDEEDDQPDENGATDHEVAEALDHHAGVAVEKDEPRGGDVEGQPEHGGHQDERREYRELERALHLHGREKDQDRPGDVGGDEEVDHEGG